MTLVEMIREFALLSWQERNAGIEFEAYMRGTAPINKRNDRINELYDIWKMALDRREELYAKLIKVAEA